jgi:hypothetical protein
MPQSDTVGGLRQPGEPADSVGSAATFADLLRPAWPLI